jgi:beta-lactamase regulating signal transducer with metallopeptidase domain
LAAESLRAIPLILLLWGLQRFGLRWISPRWMKLLWLLVLVRLFVPDLVASRASIYGWPSLLSPQVIQSAEATGSPVPAIISIVSATAAFPVHEGWNLLEILTACWLLGALGLSGAMVWQCWRFHHRFAGLRPCTDPNLLESLEDAKEHVQMWTPVSLVVNESIIAPTLYGFFRPRLLIPAILARSLSLQEMDCIIRHELAHIRAGDIALNWLVSFAVMVHWFNPFVWLMARQWARTRELACDRAALAQRNDPQAYGEVILRAAEHLSRPHLVAGVVGIVENKNNLRERIEMLTHTYGKKTGLIALGVVVLIATLFLSDPIAAAPDYAAMGAAVRAQRREYVASAIKAADAWMTFIDTQKYPDSPPPEYANNQRPTPKAWHDLLISTYPPFGKFQTRHLRAVGTLETYDVDIGNGETIKGPAVAVYYTSIFKSEDGTIPVQQNLWMTRSPNGVWHTASYSDSYPVR